MKNKQDIQLRQSTYSYTHIPTIPNIPVYSNTSLVP